ncbi:hypothetical protein [Candidatus Sororendozoicomonas aggregata]|uniref:hypothetical protein n=1 Tax=Candidatus Sororendozoicomonas aggregata TaxID=3073239 RepID=UPI002ED398E7
MSNGNAFGTGFLQGLGAINSLYDRKLRQQEYADNKAFQQKKYDDSRADRAQDADYRNKVFGLHQQKAKAQNQYYDLRAQADRQTLNNQQRQQIIGQGLNALKHRPRLWDERIKPALLKGLNKDYGQQIGQGKAITDLRMAPDGKGLIPILAVEDGKGGHYQAPMTQRRSNHPDDPAAAATGDLFVDLLMDADRDTALSMLQEELRQVETGSETAKPSAPYKLERIKIPSADGTDIEERSVKFFPDGTLRMIEVNEDGQLLGGAGADDPLAGALEGMGETQAPLPPTETSPPPPTVPGKENSAVKQTQFGPTSAAPPQQFQPPGSAGLTAHYLNRVNGMSWPEMNRPEYDPSNIYTGHMPRR